MNTAAIPRVHGLARFGMNSPNAGRLAQFYERAFEAHVQSRERTPERRFERRCDIRGGAECTVLQLGDTTIELLQFDYPGRSYPRDLLPYDTRFQHLAIAVTDMRLAMERLSQTAGWAAISTDGPQKLPESAGGVTAFKFRDPDGHPLEFLQFPNGNMPAHWLSRAATGVYIGIDHSAIGVAEVDRSVQFYGALGLRISMRSLNQGLEQQRLDGISDPLVDVVGLAPSTPTPHVELLHYRSATSPVHEGIAYNDMAATRLVFRRIAVGGAGDPETLHRLIQDPDGHLIETVPL